MKKLIAISVVFALVAGAAFAADVGAEVIGKVDIANGSTGKFHDEGGEQVQNMGTDYSGRLRVSAGGENDEGTFGAWFRYESGISGAGDNAYAHAWWKPVEQVKLTIGTNEDGWFGLDGVTRWGFHQVAGDVGVADASNAWGGGNHARNYGDGLSVTFSDAFFGGWTDGLWLNIVPVEALEINIGIPYGGDDVMGVYKQTIAQVAYNIDGIGKAGVTFQMGRGYNEKKGWADPAGQLWAYFGLTAIENLSIDIGLGYTLSYTTFVDIDNPLYSAEDAEAAGDDYDIPEKLSWKNKKDKPIAFGLGAHYTAGDFGVKARTVASLAGKNTLEGGDSDPDPLNLLFDVMPYYAVNESLTVHFNLGLAYLAADKDAAGETVKDSSRVGWQIEPYLTIKSSWWAPNFYVGIRVESDGAKTYGKDGKGTNTNWYVPMGIVVAF
jgi:hypothetical protein